MPAGSADLNYNAPFQPALDPSGESFKVTGLLPRSDPFAASSAAVENLYNVVSGWPAEAMLALTLRSRKAKVDFTGWVNLLAPSDCLADVGYALSPVARIKRTTGPRTAVSPVLEVVPERPDRGLASAPDPFATTPLLGAGRAAVPFPSERLMWDLLSVLLSSPGTSVSILMSPASELEQQLSDAVWRAAFDGAAIAEWQLYRGTPVRTRVIIGADRGHVPARMTAELKAMSQRIAFAPLEDPDRRKLRLPEVESLKGYGLPKGAFLSLVHVPAAGERRPVPGLRVLPPERRLVPFDPPPKPADALELGRCVTTKGKSRPVWLTPQDMCRHLRVVGATGAGKSTVVRGLVPQAIEAGYGVLVLDKHGPLAADLISDIRDPDRVRYLDYSDSDRVVPINPLRGPTVTAFEAQLQAFMNIIVERDTEEFTGPRWRRAFGLVARAAWTLLGQDFSIVTLFEVLDSPELTRELVENLRITDANLADQLRQELGNITGETSADLRAWLACKGEEILGSQAMVRVLGTGAHAIDLIRAMDESQVILVNLGVEQLGERSAQLLGCSLISELPRAMMTRRDRSKPFLVVIDEAHLFQFGALPSLLDEGRKFGISVVVCHQRPDQLRFQLKDALAANAGSYVQFRTGNPHDAAQASAMLDNWPTGDLLRMPDLHAIATLSRDGTPSQPFSIEFDYYRRHAAELADTELRQFRADYVRENSYDQLVKPYEHLQPISRDGLANAFREARSRARDARLDSHRVTLQQAPPTDQRVPSWMSF